MGRTSTSWAEVRSGNPGGRSKAKLFADALRIDLEAAGDDRKMLRASLAR